MYKLAIIDSDSLCYLGSKDDDLQQIIKKVDDKIQDMLNETKVDYYVLFVSKGKYFRHDISKSKEHPEGTYKSNRTYLTQPWVKTIKEYLIVKYNAIWVFSIEADDLCAYWMNQDICIDDTGTHFEPRHIFESALDVCKSNPFTFESVEKVLCAKDKDLLYSIPGRHLNFSKKLGPDEWGMEWVETSINDAPFFIWEQMICGDTGDNVVGLWKKGKAWCDKNFAGKSLKDVQHLVFDEYMKDYGTEKGIYEFQKNYRLLHMLNCDEDFIREIGTIPPLPKINEVKRQIDEVKTEIEF